MRLATAFLLAAVPTYAAAESTPAAHHKPAAHRPVSHKPTARKPSVHKPGPVKPPPKPTPPKPAAAAKPAATAASEPPKVTNSGLPVPRFAALKTDDVNFRLGPGTRYAIEWVYQRRDLPVEIEREFDVWRLVVDPNGTKGWAHNGTLTRRRTAITTGPDQTLRQAASDTAAPVAKLGRGVILRLRSCEAKSDWCQVEINEYRGFLKRNEIWGILPGEAVP